jgi:hypothetical protein
MPNLLDSILADDAVYAFCDPDAFGERVIFTPRTVVHATATVTVAAGAVTAITVVTAGSNYTVAPPVLIEGDGSGATATATVVDGEITAITVTGGGENYTTATVVVGGVYAMVERNPPVDPSVPAAPRPKMVVSLPVAKVPSVDSGGDTVTVSERIGGTARAFLIGAPVKQDAGVWLVPLA